MRLLLNKIHTHFSHLITLSQNTSLVLYADDKKIFRPVYILDKFNCRTLQGDLLRLEDGVVRGNCDLTLQSAKLCLSQENEIQLSLSPRQQSSRIYLGIQ